MSLSDTLTRILGAHEFTFDDAVRVTAGDGPAPRRHVATTLPDLADAHPELADGGLSYAAHIAARETAFRDLLGETDPPDRVLSPADPHLAVNWPGGGLLRWRPADAAITATHGLAQPDDPDAPVPDPAHAWSGLGLEYLTRTDAPADWPVPLLLHLVRYELFQNTGAPFTVGATIPTDLGGGLTHFFGTWDSRLPHELLLPAGRCALVTLVGITRPERDRLRAVDDRRLGAGALIRVLRRYGVDGTTRPGRPCVTDAPDFEQTWTRALHAAASGEPA